MCCNTSDLSLIDCMDRGVRSAEKDRVSTCPLADRIADACIKKYQGLRGTDEAINQGVLAGIVLTIDDTDLHVLSIAMGNKFQNTAKSSSDATKVRDCHAEVLVRRAFKFWLFTEWSRMHKNPSYFSQIFSLTPDARLILKSGVKIFLYVSSAPCGNACIRRWGQAQKEVFDSSLGSLQLPESSHGVFHAHAKKEGQTAITFKGQSDTLSCSDKILKWNTLGLQGTRLRSLVQDKLVLDGIVVGRKFVSVHAQRAFCCRFASKNVSKRIRDEVHHPALMCSAVKFDTGTFNASDGEGAVFDSRSFWWADGKHEEIDGYSGVQVDGSISALSSHSFEERSKSLGIQGPSQDALELDNLVKLELNNLYST